jgi:acetyl-CoA carboxylase carboxyl transferase subunit beta
MAQRQKVGAFDLLEEGIVHVVVPERPVAHENPEAFAQAIVATCVAAIRDTTRVKQAEGDRQRGDPHLHLDTQ